jgi:hypothetical protein
MARAPDGDKWSIEGRTWEFTATPPPGRGRPLSAPAHVQVLLRGTPLKAEVVVSGQVVSRVDRRTLRDWLVRPDPRAPTFRHPPLLLRRTEEVVYLQLEGYTAPMILTRQAVRSIARILRD